MTTKTFCPYAWNHLSSNANGGQRLCCNVIDASHIKNNEGNLVYINEIDNLLDYFNLDHYKRNRLNMLNGVENPECQLCYNIEKNGGHSIRQYALKQYSYDEFKDITNQETGEISEVRVNYLDLSWSNKCNLQCRMCSPWASDQLLPEYRDIGLSLPDNMDFDFMKKWKFEDISPVIEKVMTDHLNMILVTGGEPLVNNEFYKLCAELNKRGLSKNINLSFHTNLTVLPQKWDEVFAPFKSVTFKVSIDGVKDVYEYIRYPGKWSIIRDNIHEVCQAIMSGKDNFEIEFHTVFALYNMHGMTELFDFLLSLPNAKKIRRTPHINYVYNPAYASPGNIPAAVKEQIIAKLEHWVSVEGPMLAVEKLSIIKANIEILKQHSLPEDQIAINLDLLKKIDRRRNQDTAKYIPWVLNV